MTTPHHFLQSARAVSAISALSATALWAIPVSAEDVAFHPLNIVKECSQDTGKSGGFCSITKSSLAAIPVGSKVFYYGPFTEGPFVSSTIMLNAGGDNTAIGYCNVDNAKSTGTCTFWAGSGTLQGFAALLELTPDANGTDYHWDGGYNLNGK